VILRELYQLFIVLLRDIETEIHHEQEPSELLQYGLQVQDTIAGDLEDQSQLEAMAKARSYKKEIIIIASNAAGAKISFNLLLSLQAQGISHVVWLTDDATFCKALYYSPMRVACAHTSYLQVCLTARVQS
jgi:hypothetical protein